jgi:pimeloyl-ACP methyl ester carboxylesterase
MTHVVRREPRYESLVLRGLRHRVVWWGEQARSPVVLLHGWADSSETWQFLVDCLPEAMSFVAFDWRGFGGTEWPQQGYWFPDYFADLEAFLDTVHPDAPARIIAHSMGANVASMYGGIRPDRIEWLVNLEGIGLPPTTPEQAPGRYAQWLDDLKSAPRERRYTTLESLVDFVLTRNPAMTRDRARFLAHAWTTEDGNGGLKLAFDPRHRRTNPVLFRREEAEACWKRFAAPMLLVLAEHSEMRRRVAPEHMSEAYFRSLYRDLRILTLEGVGHMMHVEAPDVLARHITEFEAAVSARRLR